MLLISCLIQLARQGTTTAPSGWVLAEAIARAIRQFFVLKDDKGEPTNQDARRFTVMLPLSFLPAEQHATDAIFTFDAPNILGQLPYEITFQRNPRLTWTDKFAVFRADGPVRAFFHQVETEVAIKAKAEGSDFAFDVDRHAYGVDVWSNAAYGFWQNAVLARLV